MLASGSIRAQEDILFELHFEPLLHNTSLLVENNREEFASYDLTVETLKFYLSSFELYNDGKPVFSTIQNCYLLDLADPDSWKISLTIPEKLSFDQLNFQLGVDSLTNVSGAMGDDLDPVNGMYWTWQSGYINFKLEGTATTCPARNNRFQYHIGGYQAPFESLQTIQLPVNPNSKISITLNLDTIFNEVNLSENYKIMSPSESSTIFSKLLKKAFVIKR